MARQISAEPQKIPLNLPTDIDPEQAMYVIIRPATQGEKERRDQLGSEVVRIYSEETSEVMTKVQFSYSEQQRLETYLTMSDCNIEVPDPYDATKWKFLFRFRRGDDGKMRVDMTEEEFKRAWGQLNEEVASAIHDAVLIVNPQWAPNFRRTRNS